MFAGGWAVWDVVCVAAGGGMGLCGSGGDLAVDVANVLEKARTTSSSALRLTVTSLKPSGGDAVGGGGMSWGWEAMAVEDCFGC